MKGAVLVLILQAWLVPGDGSEPFLGGTLKHGAIFNGLGECESVKEKGADYAAFFLAQSFEDMWKASAELTGIATQSVDRPTVLIKRKQWCEPYSPAWGPPG